MIWKNQKNRFSKWVQYLQTLSPKQLQFWFPPSKYHAKSSNLWKVLQLKTNYLYPMHREPVSPKCPERGPYWFFSIFKVSVINNHRFHFSLPLNPRSQCFSGKNFNLKSVFFSVCRYHDSFKCPESTIDTDPSRCLKLFFSVTADSTFPTNFSLWSSKILEVLTSREPCCCCCCCCCCCLD